MRRTLQEINDKIKTLELMHEVYENPLKSWTDLDGIIPKLEFDLMQRNETEWPLITGYSRSSLKLLIDYKNLDSSILKTMIKDQFDNWKQFDLFKDKWHLVDKTEFYKKGIIPNQIYEKLHAIGWILRKHEYSMLDLKSIISDR